MKVRIKNFGPISDITFDLSKGFHLIYGQNSIGKSYATYCLYCIMKNLLNKSIPSSEYYYQNSKFFISYKERLKSLFKGSKNKKVDTESLITFAEDFLTEQIQQLLMPAITTSLLNTFSSFQNLRNGYSKINYSIALEFADKSNFLMLSDESGVPYFDRVEIKKNWEYVEKNTISTKHTLKIASKKVIGCPTEEVFIKEFLLYQSDLINRVLQRLSANIKDVYYLPASRSGLYQALSSFTPILAELTQNRFFLSSKKIELPSLSEPLSDYFIDISTIDQKATNSQYKEIIDELEKDILQGTVRYDSETRKIKYKPFDLDFELDISEVSSMIAELSPIVIFLKHVLHHKFSSDDYSLYSIRRPHRSKENDLSLIFIEEPEAHLHPEVQVKLSEVFTKLTKYRMKIVMTSHSNYMFNKINNLLIKKELDSKTVCVYHLIKSSVGSVVNTEMKMTDEGISDENFTDVSKKLYDERINSLED